MVKLIRRKKDGDTCCDNDGVFTMEHKDLERERSATVFPARRLDGGLFLTFERTSLVCRGKSDSDKPQRNTEVCGILASQEDVVFVRTRGVL